MQIHKAASRPSRKASSEYFTGTVCAQSNDQNAVKASKGLYIAACVTAWIAYIFAVMNK